MTLHDDARAYYALCDEADRLGIPISLDDTRSPRTVELLKQAVADRQRDERQSR